MSGVTQVHRFALIAPPLPSHIYTMCALGRELQRRGHYVVFFGVPDSRQLFEAEGISFEAIGQVTHPLGVVPAFRTRLSEMKGLPAIRLALAEVVRMNRTFFAELPGCLERHGIEALLADQGEPVAGTIAEHAGIPWITVCNALPFNADPDLPPTITPWRFRPDTLGRLRNRAGYFLLERMTASIARGIAEQRRYWKLPQYQSWNDVNSPYLQLAQNLEVFDFPYRKRPTSLHYTGPFRRRSHVRIPFPWARLTERPVVYTSMGTLQNRQFWIFHVIAEACAMLPMQLVISLGGGARREEIGQLAGDPVVVDFAPQMALLERSCLFITHGGLNSVQEALLEGVPLVVVPITNDQFGVAARVEWIGAGERLSLRRLSATRLRGAIERVLSQPTYRREAERLKQAMVASGGVVRAADLTEAVVQSASAKVPVARV
jgi:zeaxanthin glucosyltransferase